MGHFGRLSFSKVQRGSDRSNGSMKQSSPKGGALSPFHESVTPGSSLSSSSPLPFSPREITDEHSFDSSFEVDHPIGPPALASFRACHSAPLPRMPGRTTDPPITRITDLSPFFEPPQKPKMRSPPAASARPYVAIEEIFGHQGGLKCDHFGSWIERKRFSGDPVNDIRKVAALIQKVVGGEKAELPPIEECSVSILSELQISEELIERPRIQVRYAVVKPARPPVRRGEIQHFFVKQLINDADRKLMSAFRMLDRICARFHVPDRRCLFLPMRVRNRKLTEFLEPMQDFIHFLLAIQDAELRYYCEVLQIEIPPEMRISPDWPITKAISCDELK
jgi:hypothetical protein